MNRALMQVFEKVGLGEGSAEIVGHIVATTIHTHDDEDINPVDMSRWSIAIGGIGEVDDVQGFTDALGHLATALINIEDALA